MRSRPTSIGSPARAFATQTLSPPQRLRTLPVLDHLRHVPKQHRNAPHAVQSHAARMVATVSDRASESGILLHQQQQDRLSVQDFRLRARSGMNQAAKPIGRHRSDDSQPFFAVFNFGGCHESGIASDAKYRDVTKDLRPGAAPRSRRALPRYRPTIRTPRSRARTGNGITS